MWAPDLLHHDGEYRLYYSVSSFGSQNSVIRMATNTTLDFTSPSYEWVDRGIVVESENGFPYNAIDAGVFYDDELDRMWLAFGSFWNGVHMLELDPATGMRISPRAPVTNIARNTGSPANAIEAPHLTKHDGRYYLFVNWDSCCRGEDSTYKIRVGRSDEPAGPFVDRSGTPMTLGGGELFLATEGDEIGPGHFSDFASRGADYFSYHYYDGDENGRSKLGIRKFVWTADGWPVVPEHLPHGDYNQDGAVTVADYSVWRDSLGREGVGLTADGDGSGVIDAGDYALWSGNFGALPVEPSGARGAPAPEPSALVLLVLGAMTGSCLMARRMAGRRGALRPRYRSGDAIGGAIAPAPRALAAVAPSTLPILAMRDRPPDFLLGDGAAVPGSVLTNAGRLSRDEFVAKAQGALARDQLDLAHTYALVGLSCYPDSAPLLEALGWAYARSGDVGIAETTFRHALSLDGACAGAHAGLAATLAMRERYGEADRSYREALRLESHSAHTLFNHGCALLALRRLDEAIDAFERAAQLDPQLSDAHHNLGVAHAQLGRWEDTLGACERALELNPGAWQVRLLKAMALVSEGAFAEGWDEYEARLESRQCYAGLAKLPKWRGPGDAKRSLAVVPEQGVGTQLMFASCVSDLLAHVGSCTLGCDPRLITLLRRSLPGVDVVAGGALPALASSGLFDGYEMAGSLPRSFRRTRDAFPGRGYLTPDQALRKRWRGRLAALGAGLKVGVSWRGGAASADTRHRSTEVADWGGLLSAPSVNWVNLQYDAQAADVDEWRRASGGRFRAWDDLDLKHDLENAAALVSELDLVISVVNSTVHLAGALDAPTWALLPAGGEWRWLSGGGECVWHRSVRLFRQGQSASWIGPFDAVRRRLGSLATREAA